MGNVKRCPVFDCDDCPITSNCKYYSADDGCQYEREDKKAYKKLKPNGERLTVGTNVPSVLNKIEVANATSN